MSEKACIVIDVPNKCDECIFNKNMICCINTIPINENIKNGTKSDQCPLRSFPDKKDYTTGMKDSVHDYSYLVGKMHGWNSCIDRISGDIR